MKLKFSSGCWRVLSLVIFSHTFMPASSYVHRCGPTNFNVLSSLFYPGYFELIWLVSDLVIFGHTFSIGFFCPAVTVLGSTFWCGGMCWDLKGDGKACLSSLDIPERPLDKPQLTTTQSTATGVILHPFQKPKVTYHDTSWKKMCHPSASVLALLDCSWLVLSF